MNAQDMFKPPDFVVTGGEHGGKIFLVASKSLKSSELLEETQYDDIPWELRGKIFDPGITTITLTTVMRDYVVVMADNYTSAWIELFKVWSPKPDEQSAIETQKQLERGNSL